MIEPTDKLTDEEIRSLQFFAQERGDPERWVRWEEKKELIALQFPAFMFAWLNLKQAKRCFYEAAHALKTSDEIDR